MNVQPVSFIVSDYVVVRSTWKMSHKFRIECEDLIQIVKVKSEVIFKMENIMQSKLMLVHAK